MGKTPPRETAEDDKRRDEALKRALQTPPKPHKIPKPKEQKAGGDRRSSAKRGDA
jgi:hypothetical protein